MRSALISRLMLQKSGLRCKILPLPGCVQALANALVPNIHGCGTSARNLWVSKTSRNLTNLSSEPATMRSESNFAPSMFQPPPKRNFAHLSFCLSLWKSSRMASSASFQKTLSLHADGMWMLISQHPLLMSKG